MRATVRVNPVLRRELLERWRSRRAGWTLTAFLVVLAGFQYLLYRIGTAIVTSAFGFGGMDGAAAGPLLGRFLLEGLLFFMLLLVLFVTPGYAAGKLAAEWDRRTLPLLQVSLLRPHQIILGKLGASVAWIVLLVGAALPLGAASFFLGGVAVGDLVRAVAYIIGVGLCVAGIGLGIAGLSRRTAGSIVVTYGVVLLLLVGTLLGAAVEAIGMARNGNEVRTPRSLYLSPFFGLADAAGASPIGGFVELPSPLSVVASALPGPGGVVGGPDGMFREEIVMQPGLGPRFGVVPPDAPAQRADRAAVWLQVLGLYALLGLAGVLVATWRVRGIGTGVRRRRGAAAKAVTPSGVSPQPASDAAASRTGPA